MLTKYIVVVARTGESPRIWNEFNRRRDADQSARARVGQGWDYIAVYERRSQKRDEGGDLMEDNGT